MGERLHVARQIAGEGAPGHLFGLAEVDALTDVGPGQVDEALTEVLPGVEGLAQGIDLE